MPNSSPPPRDNGTETRLNQRNNDQVIICWLWPGDHLPTRTFAIIQRLMRDRQDGSQSDCWSFPSFWMPSISRLGSFCLGCDSAQPIHACDCEFSRELSSWTRDFKMVMASKAASVTLDWGRWEKCRASSSRPTQWNKDSQHIDDFWKILVRFGISKSPSISWVLTPSSILSGGNLGIFTSWIGVHVDPG